MTYLIKNCQILTEPELVDVEISADQIKRIKPNLAQLNDHHVIDAAGGLLIPGLHDHHIHLMSLAASLASVNCGPPEVTDEQQLKQLLQSKNKQQSKPNWLRGIGYHSSVAGNIDRHWLDAVIPDRPVRIQDRGGRLWILNSNALDLLGLLINEGVANLPDGIEYEGKLPTGRLYECDKWLRNRLNSKFPCLNAASQYLASQGVTGVTDTTPSNSANEWAYFEKSQQDKTLLQKVRMMGDLKLPLNLSKPTLQAGEYKVHLLETELPEMNALIGNIQKAHNMGRNVAIHCVTHTELVFAIACLESAKVKLGDRIEHASVTTQDMLESIHKLGLRVISQPHFIYERGERYIKEVDPDDQAWLYRQHSFIKANIPLAAGSDAPFGSSTPWASMQAAVKRETMAGNLILPEEKLTPEIALKLYTSEPEKPGILQKQVAIGSAADLCLLKTPWEHIKTDLSKAKVRATWIDGKLVYKSV